MTKAVVALAASASVACLVALSWWLTAWANNTARDGLRAAARAERRLYQVVNPTPGTSTTGIA